MNAFYIQDKSSAFLSCTQDGLNDSEKKHLKIKKLPFRFMPQDRALLLKDSPYFALQRYNMFSMQQNKL